MPPVQIPGVKIQFVTGPLVLGYMFGFGLFGILVVQMYIYHLSFPGDRTMFKALGHLVFHSFYKSLREIFGTVWSVFTLELLFTSFTTIAAWNDYGKGWGDPDTLVIIDWSWEPLPALNGFIGMMVQLFFCWRIFQLTKYLWLPGLISCISVMQCGVTFYFGIKDSIEGRTFEELKKLSTFSNIWVSGSAACDILITISLVTILLRESAKSSFKRTTSTLTKVIKFTIETGLVTSVGALLELILWLSIPQYNFHFIFFLVLGKLYSNSLLATLNSRTFLRERMQGVVDVNRSQTRSALWADISTGPTPFQRGTIHVTTTKDVQRDEDREMVVVSPDQDNGLFLAKEGHTLSAQG